MRFKRSIAAAFAAVAGVAMSAGAAIPAGVPAAAASAPATVVNLPIRTFSHLLIDPVHHHLFITSGAFSSSILVTDYSGQTVATIQDEPSATGLALSSDGSTVYAALPDGDAISAISTSTLAETARYATGTGTEPTYVADTKGKIWFGYGGSGEGEIGWIDPRTSPATVTLKAVPRFWYAAPMLAATEGGELVGGEPGISPVQMASYDVSSGAATVLAQGRSLDQASDLESMQLTPDGKDVVIASDDPSYHGVYRVSDLSPDGTYPTAASPTAVSIAADGTVAAGTCCEILPGGGTTNEIFMFAPGSSTPLNTIGFGRLPVKDDGLALTPDGSLLFAVSEDTAPVLDIIPDPKQPGPHTTSTVVGCSRGPIAIGQPATCTATVTDVAPAGPTTPTGTVTFAASVSGGTFSSTSCPLAPSAASGQASCSVSYTPEQAKPVTITGTYGGDSTHQASSLWTTIGVVLRATTTVLTCQQHVVLQLDQCTATVNDTSPGTAAAPVGTVTFTASGRGLFSATQCTLSGRGSSASCAVYYAPAPGDQAMSVSYPGDSIHKGGTGSTTLSTS